MNAISQILNSIQNGQIKSVYYLKGEEKYFHDQFIDTITSNIFPDQSARDLNLHIYYGTENTIAEVISAVSSFPMFAEFKLIIVRDFHQMTISDLESFIKYLQHPQKSCCLVLSATEPAKKEIDHALKQNSEVVDCPRIRSWHLPKWVQNYCKTMGYSINEQAAAYVAEQTGENLLALEQELQKIFSFKSTDKNITTQDLEQTTGLTNDYNIFALQDALLDKNFQRCIKISKRLLDSGLNIHPIIGSLFTFYRKFLMVRLWGDKKSEQEILKNAQVRDFQLKKYRSHYARYPIEHIRQAIILLQKFDVDLKTSNTEDFSGLQMIFYKICSQ